MSPFKFAFKKVSAPCCGPRSKNKRASSQTFPVFEAAGSSPQRKVVNAEILEGSIAKTLFCDAAGLSSSRKGAKVGMRNSCRTTQCDSISTTNSICSTSVSEAYTRCSLTGNTSTASLPEVTCLEAACTTPSPSTAHGNCFLLPSALSSLDDMDEYQLDSNLSTLSAASSNWSIAETAEKNIEYNEEEALEELQESIKQTQKQIIEKQRHLKAIEKEAQWDLFCRTKQQAHYGECFAIVYCAVFRLRSIMRGSH